MRFRMDELEVFFPYDRMYLEPSNKLLIRRAVHFSRCLPELVKLRCLLSLITCNVPASHLPICKFKCWKVGILYTNCSWNECSNGRGNGTVLAYAVIAKTREVYYTVPGLNPRGLRWIKRTVVRLRLTYFAQDVYDKSTSGQTKEWINHSPSFQSSKL